MQLTRPSHWSRSIGRVVATHPTEWSRSSHAHINRDVHCPVRQRLSARGIFRPIAEDSLLLEGDVSKGPVLRRRHAAKQAELLLSLVGIQATALDDRYVNDRSVAVLQFLTRKVSGLLEAVARPYIGEHPFCW